MQKYTWDDLYNRADGAACGEDTLKAKDTAREQVRQFVIMFGLDDPEKEECPEDAVDDYCKEYNICFDENGNIVDITNYENNYMMYYDNKIGGTISIIYGVYAKEAGVTISCDLNYRNKLWSKEKAGKVMAELCQYVDVCIANEEDAADVFGITSKGTDVTTGTVNREGYKDVAKQLADRFGFEKVAITLRESISANDNNWSAMLYDGKDYYFSKKYKMHIVDRVGGGDSFGGGLICACLNEYGPQETIEFAVAASCLKHSIEGDYNMVSMDEVLKLAGGDGSGRVQR